MALTAATHRQTLPALKAEQDAYIEADAGVTMHYVVECQTEKSSSRKSPAAASASASPSLSNNRWSSESQRELVLICQSRDRERAELNSLLKKCSKQIKKTPPKAFDTIALKTKYNMI